MDAFELAYRLFLADRGFRRPCVEEQFERDYRQRTPHRPATCIHGLTRATCGECDVNGWRPAQGV